MNEEPIAYVNSMCNDYIDWKVDPMSIDGQPLYTHPAKTLTDEEITDVYKEISEPFGEKRLYEIHDFARAILRKAQEK
jgi:hypothetical protein